MSDITQFVRNRKLQEALSAIPPAKHQQEFAAAAAADKERRNELRSKFDELPTDEIERLWSLSYSRGSLARIHNGNAQVAVGVPTEDSSPDTVSEATELQL
jgi:hypothetical protein